MKKVLLIHGFQGSPNGGWRPWLMGELEKHEIWACSLSMPNPDAPIAKEWVSEIVHNIPIVSEDIFLVGHSLGVPAILNYLQMLPSGTNLGGIVLVSGFSETLSVGDANSRARKFDNFFETEFNFDAIKQKVNKFVVIHGDNDQNIPIKYAEKLSIALNADLVIVPNGGHLNGSSGWLELPQALEILLEITK